MTPLTIPDTALGAIVAAFVTSLITLLGLIISKENKTSEFRQAWIDGLRSDLSDLFAHIYGIQGAVQTMGVGAEAWKQARTDIVGSSRAISSVRLRLNPKEELPQRIFVLLDQLEKQFAAGTMPSSTELDRVEKAVLRDSQLLLKAEWKRVRNGELIFQLARGLSFASLLAALFALSYSAMGY